MQFMIMNYVPVGAAGGTATPEQPDMNAWAAYAKAMLDAGVMRGGNRLMPGHTGATLRLREGRRDVQDGPYADSKEELGGYFIIEVPDLDAALQWAARNPAASYGAVEVRAIM